MYQLYGLSEEKIEIEKNSWFMINSAEEKVKLYLEGARNYFKDIKVLSQISMYSGDSPQNAEVTFNNKVVDYQIQKNNPLQIIHYTNSLKYSKNTLYRVFTSTY